MSRVYFLMFAASGAFYPHLAVYLQAQGLTAVQVSWVLAMPPIMALIAQPLWGLVVDTQPRKFRVLAGLMFASVVLALVMRQFAGFGPILLGYMLFSAFNCAVIPVADSLALAEGAALGRDYPRMRLWGSVSFTLISAAVGVLYDRTDVGALFYVYAAIMAVTAFYVWQRPAVGVPPQRGPVWTGLRKLTRQGLLWVVLGLAFVNQVAYAAHNGFMSIYLRDLGASQEVVGLAWAIAALTEVPVFFVLGGWARRFGKERLLVLACGVWALRFYLYAHLHSANWALAVSLLQGLSFGLTYATAVMLVGEITPPEVRTSGQTLLALVTSGAGSIAGLLLGGVLVRLVGLRGMYGIITWFSVVAAVGFWGIWWWRRVTQPTPGASGQGVS